MKEFLAMRSSNDTLPVSPFERVALYLQNWYLLRSEVFYISLTRAEAHLLFHMAWIWLNSHLLHQILIYSKCADFLSRLKQIDLTKQRRPSSQSYIIFSKNCPFCYPPSNSSDKQTIFASQHQDTYQLTI